MAGEVGNKGLRFLATVIVARALSLSEFGLLNVCIAVSGVAFVVTSLGLPDAAARAVAIDARRAGWLYGRVTLIRVSALLGLLVGAMAAQELLWPGHRVLVGLSFLMAAFMAASGDWLARGLSRMGVFAVSSAAGGAALVAMSVVVVVPLGTPEAALVGFATAEAVVGLVIARQVTRSLDVRFGLSGAKAMLLEARPLALSGVVIYSYYANIDTILLAAFRSEREAGLYSAPYRLFLVLNLLGTFAAFSMLPTLSRHAARGEESQARALLERFLTGLSAYGLGCLAAVELVGGVGLKLLFGPAFAPAEGAFVVLVASVAWYAVGFPTGYSLIAQGRHSRFLRGAGAAGVANLALNLALIPVLGGVGAAIATLGAFALATVVWVAERGLLRATASKLVTATAATGGALAVARTPALGTSIGLLTAAAAVLVVVRSRARPTSVA